jgi:outer membrane receptor protein involved in Fe transport
LTGNCNQGDQFGQVDRRTVYGLNAANTWYTNWVGVSSDFTVGMQSRFDDIHEVGLNLTTARQTWATISKDRVKEASLSAYIENQTQWLEKFRSIVGLREDFYFFDVNSAPLAANSGKTDAQITSPKLSFIFGPWYHTEYYLNAGYGFHSNDARGVVSKINPNPRAAAYLSAIQPSSPLVRAKSYELGLRSAIIPHLQTTLALWQLDLASELVFSGDANTTEPSFASRRQGVEWSNFWTPSTKLTVDTDVALSRARYKQIDPTVVSGYFIPGAIEQTVSIGATYDTHDVWSGGLRLRYFGPRALIEDNSVRSGSSILVNLNLGYKVDHNIKIEVNILNLFDRKVSDIDYLYSSQLRNELSPSDAIHTHPAEPRTLRASIRFDY